MAREKGFVPMEVREFFSKQGKKGGKAAAASMTPEQRRERARKGGLAGGRGRPKKAKARKKK